ncbi:hypothetical protein DVA67_008935 [Solirubrobacter sp. CPCC 204708]|uniref:Uncharacterized protein n=1 Tax=Solirubrobacter deserti TaxID=2282478 RepID=A0ABT4RE84_9ACTN|nr:hypothetical protein [Solirubrobacter deserti]MBE2316099.1 hypothetical protein [Solirubrobacter deserti]MDA0136849.1 hypothetical protein [Solirubrobacter deserti]
MTNDSLHQRRPDRRFRRLLPAAVAAVTLASSAPFLGPASARADTTPRPERREHLKPVNPGKIPTTLRADTTRGIRLQGVSSS